MPSIVVAARVPLYVHAQLTERAAERGTSLAAVAAEALAAAVGDREDLGPRHGRPAGGRRAARPTDVDGVHLFSLILQAGASPRTACAAAWARAAWVSAVTPSRFQWKITW